MLMFNSLIDSRLNTRFQQTLIVTPATTAAKVPHPLSLTVTTTAPVKCLRKSYLIKTLLAFRIESLTGNEWEHF